MGPRVRQDDKNKKRKSRAKFSGKEQKTQHTAATPPLSFPRMRGSIHPHVPEAAFGNTLTAADNDESETTSNTNNKALKPSYSARYTRDPRVREDGGVRESMVNLLSLTHATANAKDNSCANNDGNIEASLDDCLISPFLITPSIVPLNTIFY
ncbi:hypothetical protein [Vibrio vulnificus]|uniref:hypothetical protein n=1 Tax=Vibrio vulnificus TaxID=672 RepID=UPI0032420D74